MDCIEGSAHAHWHGQRIAGQAKTRSSKLSASHFHLPLSTYTTSLKWFGKERLTYLYEVSLIKKRKFLAIKS
jgi:hypothetical protein